MTNNSNTATTTTDNPAPKMSKRQARIERIRNRGLRLTAKGIGKDKIQSVTEATDYAGAERAIQSAIGPICKAAKVPVPAVSIVPPVSAGGLRRWTGAGYVPDGLAKVGATIEVSIEATANPAVLWTAIRVALAIHIARCKGDSDLREESNVVGGRQYAQIRYLSGKLLTKYLGQYTTEKDDDARRVVFGAVKGALPRVSDAFVPDGVEIANLSDVTWSEFLPELKAAKAKKQTRKATTDDETETETESETATSGGCKDAASFAATVRHLLEATVAGGGMTVEEGITALDALALELDPESDADTGAEIIELVA